MTEEVKKSLEFVKKTLEEAMIYGQASSIINFDMETICPPAGMEREGEVAAFLGNKVFTLLKQDEFIKAGEVLYAHKDELDEETAVLATSLHKDYIRNKNITPEMNLEFSKIYNKSYVDWVNAKQKKDYSLFAPSLQAVKDIEIKKVELLDEKKEVLYDNFIDMYEPGMTTKMLDEYFDKCRERLVPMLKKIQNSKKKIRTDFMFRTVTDEAQQKMARYLLEIMGYDFNRAAFTTTEHPFTTGIGKNDERVTTHYYPNMFISSMYSIIHEGGHALFDMYSPAEHWDSFIETEKSMGQHESVSRFYENRIGRSEAFIHLIYDKVKEIFPEVMADVSERELYEAVNYVEASLIRTEADEFTYNFHIMIRYELEKELLNGNITIEELPQKWNDKYEEYLGVRPSNDAEGVLQDVHWSSGFGYFPTYALGNAYNAMYYNRMKNELDIDKLVSEGHIDKINEWMKENVWKRADLLDADVWLKEITGRDFDPTDFLDYLEEKFSKLYELD